MKSNKYLGATLVLFIIAALAAAYSVWHHYALINGEFAGAKSFCSVGPRLDCDAVNTSSFSELLGIPVATLGFSYYLFGIILTLTALKSTFSRRTTLLLLFPFTVVGLLASLFQFTVAEFVLGKTCMMCAVMQAAGVGTFIFVLLSLRELLPLSTYFSELRKVPRGKFGSTAALLIGIFVISHAISSQLREGGSGDTAMFRAHFESTPPVAIPAVEDVPRLGHPGPNPPVEIIEFSDFQCPACAMAAGKMNFLLKRYGDRIQLRFHFFPLDAACNRLVGSRMHPSACFAAKAAYCANKQSKFEDFHYKIYSHVRDLTNELVLKLATESGMDMAQLDACMNAPATQAVIERDVELGSQLGVQATPTFFVNGKRVEGVIDEPLLKVMLESLGK